MTTAPTQTQTPTTGATQTGGTTSGLVPKQPTPAQQDTPYVPKGTALDAQGKTEEERKREQQEAEAKKKKKNEGNWWERNQDWLIPLIAALVGGAIGLVLAKLLGAQNTAAVNSVVSNIDLDKKDQPAQNDTTQALAAAGTQATTDTPTNPQNGAQVAVATAAQGRC